MKKEKVAYLRGYRQATEDIMKAVFYCGNNKLDAYYFFEVVREWLEDTKYNLQDIEKAVENAVSVAMTVTSEQANETTEDA